MVAAPYSITGNVLRPIAVEIYIRSSDRAVICERHAFEFQKVIAEDGAAIGDCEIRINHYRMTISNLQQATRQHSHQSVESGDSSSVVVNARGVSATVAHHELSSKAAAVVEVYVALCLKGPRATNCSKTK